MPTNTHTHVHTSTHTQKDNSLLVKDLKFDAFRQYHSFEGTMIFFHKELEMFIKD